MNERGWIWYDTVTREVVGVASDGKEVSLGHDCESALRYLAAHPTPEDW